jgi:hypothetical protein
MLCQCLISRCVSDERFCPPCPTAHTYKDALLSPAHNAVALQGGALTPPPPPPPPPPACVPVPHPQEAVLEVEYVPAVIPPDPQDSTTQDDWCVRGISGEDRRVGVGVLGACL